jgi:hypothetical protein
MRRTSKRFSRRIPIVRSTATLLALLLALSCTLGESRATDATITANAESHRQWNQKLHRAVPNGIGLDSAFAVLRRNGFICFDPDKVGRAVCQKTARRDILDPSNFYQWRAEFRVKKGLIVSVRGVYDHSP